MRIKELNQSDLSILFQCSKVPESPKSNPAANGSVEWLKEGTPPLPPSPPPPPPKSKSSTVGRRSGLLMKMRSILTIHSSQFLLTEAAGCGQEQPPRGRPPRRSRSLELPRGKRDGKMENRHENLTKMSGEESVTCGAKNRSSSLDLCRGRKFVKGLRRCQSTREVKSVIFQVS